MSPMSPFVPRSTCGIIQSREYGRGYAAHSNPALFFIPRRISNTHQREGGRGEGVTPSSAFQHIPRSPHPPTNTHQPTTNRPHHTTPYYTTPHPPHTTHDQQNEKNMTNTMNTGNTGNTGNMQEGRRKEKPLLSRFSSRSSSRSSVPLLLLPFHSLPSHADRMERVLKRVPYEWR